MQVWDHLISLQDYFINEFENDGVEVFEEGMERFNQKGWINRVWKSTSYRRAHVDVVDAREDKNLWMMHVCIFPHLTSDAPIFGFDVICGPNKMTGAFHDFSPTTNQSHPMIEYFGKAVEDLEWDRERELPDWAKAIFSGSMMAAGNVREDTEINQVRYTVIYNLQYYLDNVAYYSGNSDEALVTEAQNNYARYQKQNPHTPRVMKSIGLDPDDVDAFVQHCLFPEIKT